MAAIEHDRDPQPLGDHVLKELGQLDIPKVASRGVANVDWDEGFVDSVVSLDQGEQCRRAAPVAGVMDIDVIAWVGLLSQMLERRDDVLVGWPPLRRLGSAPVPTLVEVNLINRSSLRRSRSRRKSSTS